MYYVRYLKRNKMKITILFVFIFCPFLTIISQSKDMDKSFSYGLNFKSHEVNKDDRTSLDLLPDGFLKLSKGYTLEFDLKLTNSNHTYGYIFRIIANDTTSLDMTSYLGNNRINFILNGIHNTKASSEYKYERKQLEGKWVNVKIEVRAGSVTFSIDGEEILIDTPDNSLGISTIEKIYFGANRHKFFYTSDVPPMSVKNIEIKDDKGKIVRRWDMGRHTVAAVYDDTNGYRATVSNGIWEIDRHTNWNKEMSLITRNIYPQIATDSINNRVFVATNDSLYIMHLKNKSVQRIKVGGGRPFQGASSYLIYDYIADRLVSYSISHPEPMLYNFDTNMWSGSPSDMSLYVQHHNRFINPDTNQLVVFGGYGLYRYSAALSTYDLNTGEWETNDLIDQLSPRYLSSMGYLGDGQILIFGGYGSKTGLQEASSYNLYDLHLVDTRAKTSKELGTLEGMPEPYVFGNSMIIDVGENKFYTLANRSDVYKSSIRLMEVNMNDFSYRFLSDSIPYNFQDTESFCDMFRYKNSAIYAVILQRTERGAFETGIYSLLYPPLSQTDILQVPGARNIFGNSPVTYIIIGLLVIIILLAIYLLRRNRMEKAALSPVVGDKAFVSPPVLPQVPHAYKEKKRSKISLLGGFQIFDRGGNDITGFFTPVIRQMFLMCLLEYIATGKGVTSERLDEEFWFDMDKNKATNNRNVNIRKLRLLLQEIGDVTFQKDNSYWHVSIGDDTFCDYVTVMNLLHEISSADRVIEKSVIEKIIGIASAGLLLPNIDKRWVDRYQSGYSDLLITTLLKAAKTIEIKDDFRLLVKLADVILIHDSIDEDSVQIKCRSLYKLGQKGLSKQCYDKFCLDYKNILNEEPQLKYDSIILSE